MKAAPLLVEWHNEKAPIWSAHFEPHGKGRLATAGGDNNVRLWHVDQTSEERNIAYLSTLAKHTQAVNVVRWCPRVNSELLASAGDDGNVLLWVRSDLQSHSHAFGTQAQQDKETWIVKRMCRSNSGAETYDLAWSPDGTFFITGSMDNVARIFDAQSGTIIRQIAEHNHYVQGVAWDPLNEFIATQSSDRSVHVYKLRNNDGQFSLARHGRMTKMDLPGRRISSNSPAPPDFGHRAHLAVDGTPHRVASPVPFTPGTPNSLAQSMNMDPPPISTQSRRSSIGNASPLVRRSASPAPSTASMPLPAVMPPASPNPHLGLGLKNANIYANETLTSFFRRLTFTPDGSLLLTPAGQYKSQHFAPSDMGRLADDVINTVYIYSRAGLNKPPVAHLPGHKKPSIAVRCSPVLYTLRTPATTKHMTLDSSSIMDDMAPLPDPIMQAKLPPSSSSMDPPPLNSIPAPSPASALPLPSSRQPDSECPSLLAGPPSAFSLPYRVVYAVATQDSVLVYDTQQQTPLCVVSNLHYAAFTDLTWANDGTTLLMTSSDGFCSYLGFASAELGTVYTETPQARSQRLSISDGTVLQSTSIQSTLARSNPVAPGASGMPMTSVVRPASPTRTNSASSVATQSSFAQTPASGVIVSNPTPSLGSVPGIAASSSHTTGTTPLTAPTPPLTPLGSAYMSSSTGNNVQHENVLAFSSLKRVGSADVGDGVDLKKRRVAPTLVVAPTAEHAPP